MSGRWQRGTRQAAQALLATVAWPMRALLQVIFRLQSNFPLVTGGLYSPLELAVERVSRALVEGLFAGSRVARAIVRAYGRYLGDPEAERALKKGFHLVYEARLRTLALRADPPATHEMGSFQLLLKPHALDSFAARDLTGLGVRVDRGFSALSCLRLAACQWMIAVGQGLEFLYQALRLYLCHGMNLCEPVRCLIASPNFLPQDRWIPLMQALEALGCRSPDKLLFVLERRDAQTSPRLFPTLDPATLPVPRASWLRQVLLPGTRLFLELLVLTIRSVADVRHLILISECFRQAHESLGVWRVAYNVSFVSYLDNEEYRTLHNIKAIIFRKFGGQLVRWPATQIDTPGAGLSYLGYDLFLSGGDYQFCCYGDSWSRRTRCVSVGMISSDARVTSGHRLAPGTSARIEGHLLAGGKAAGFFPGSLLAGTPYEWKAPVIESLVALRAALQGDPTWLVVIKPKGIQNALYDWMEADPRLSGWLGEEQLLAIRPDKSGGGYVPVGWLFDRITMGVCDGGSVQIEGLVRGLPMFAYRPLWPETPLLTALERWGFNYTDPGKLELAIRRFLEAPEEFEMPETHFFRWFDPFGDDRAMLRVAALLLGRDTDPVILPPSAQRENPKVRSPHR